jgi:sensor histidine kinase YesM
MDEDQLAIKEIKIMRLIVDDRYKLLRHAVLLLGTLIIISCSNKIQEYSGTYQLLWLLCVFVTLITMSYVNMYVLVPRFFFKGRYILYVVSLLLLVLVCRSLMSEVLDGLRLAAHRRKADNGLGTYESTLILIPIILVTTMIKLFQRWMRDNERITQLRNVTLMMELNELRNQINPHFLFNMLNGIKALVRSDPEKATTVIMKLSEFLRYQLYDNNEEKTLLKSEIAFLQNFLELEKLRRDKLTIEINSQTPSTVLNSVFLPPNLFTTFIENAVKHSVGINERASYIRICIEVKEAELQFRCVNSTDPAYIPSSGKNSGLGLVNIKKRLKLLYGDRQSLETASAGNEYHVTLKIPV